MLEVLRPKSSSDTDTDARSRQGFSSGVETRASYLPRRLPQHHTDQTRTLEVLKVSLQKWRLWRLDSPEAASASHRLGGMSSPTSHQNSRLGDEGAHAGVRTRACVCVCVCLSV